MHGAGGKLEMRGARVGGKLDRDTALFEHDRQRLRRKQMAAGAASTEQDEVVYVACGHGLSTVMPGLVPGIHVFLILAKQGVDGRDKPGHDKI